LLTLTLDSKTEAFAPTNAGSTIHKSTLESHKKNLKISQIFDGAEVVIIQERN
jgi:hypothetical protein